MKEEIYFTEEFGRQTHSGNKIGPKVDFLLFSQVWFTSFPSNCIQ